MMLYMLKFRIRYENYPIPDNVNKSNGAVSKNRYNIFLRHNIAFTFCLHIKGQLFFFFVFLFCLFIFIA